MRFFHKKEGILIKMYLSENDIATYHRGKFQKKIIDLELIDFITPYGYATIGELEKNDITCELTGRLINYKPKNNHWYKVTEHGLEFDKTMLNPKQKEFLEFIGSEPEECLDELEELEGE